MCQTGILFTVFWIFLPLISRAFECRLSSRVFFSLNAEILQKSFSGVYGNLFFQKNGIFMQGRFLG